MTFQRMLAYDAYTIKPSVLCSHCYLTYGLGNKARDILGRLTSSVLLSYFSVITF